MKKRKHPKSESSDMVVGGSGHISLHGRKRLVVVGLVVLLLTAGTVFVFLSKNHTDTATKVNHETLKANKYVLERDRSQALAHARKALSYAPDDPDTILAVANLTEDPSEAKQLYAHALEVLKIQDNPDVSGKKAVTYWAAAELAERAGLTDQAKQYYQKVIDAANPSNSYEQSLVKKSQAALTRLH